MCAYVCLWACMVFVRLENKKHESRIWWRHFEKCLSGEMENNSEPIPEGLVLTTAQISWQKILHSIYLIPPPPFNSSSFHPYHKNKNFRNNNKKNTKGLSPYLDFVSLPTTNFADTTFNLSTLWHHITLFSCLWVTQRTDWAQYFHFWHWQHFFQCLQIWKKKGNTDYTEWF